MAFPCPRHSYTEELSWDVAQTDPAIGAVLRGNRRDHPIRIHRLSFNVDAAGRDAIVAEHDAAQGAAGVVTSFQPPDDAGAVDCYFADEPLSVRWVSVGRFEIDCRLVEVKPVLA